jgi:hypothetical protein
MFSYEQVREYRYASKKRRAQTAREPIPLQSARARSGGVATPVNTPPRGFTEGGVGGRERPATETLA